MSRKIPQNPSKQLLAQLLNPSAMRQQVLVQLEKDLQTEFIATDVEATDFFEVLHRETANKISYIIHNQPDKLAQLLYKIDLNEAKIRDALQSTSGNVDTLVEAIVKREMLKVFYRNVYSGKLKI